MKHLLAILFLFFSAVVLGQSLRVISTFPNYLNENSGLIVKTNNSAWIHNDSGDGPIIYKIDSNGIQLDSIYLNGITAIDFEDITQDNQGNVYVGDIGNNNHNRTNLVVYKIPNPDSLSSNAVTPEAIHYHYSDQTQFPDPNQNSDCEALFHFNNHLYLISKNWGNSGYSKLYELPDTSGTHVAQLIDSFASPMVTAADYHPSGKLAVLSMDRVTVFDQFVGNHFFNGRNSTFFFPLTQKEGVSFVSSNSLYITQENHRFFPGAKLYEFKIGNYLSVEEVERKKDFSITPNPANDNISIIPVGDFTNKEYHYSIYNAKGQLVKNRGNNYSSSLISIEEFNQGIYFVIIKTKSELFTKRFIKQ